METAQSTLKPIGLNTPIEALKLYNRAYNFLKRANINTIGELVSQSKESLEKLIRSEWMFITDIEEKLNSLNLHLGMSEEELEPLRDNLETTTHNDSTITEFEATNEKLQTLTESKALRLQKLRELLREKIHLEEQNRILDDQIALVERELSLGEKISNPLNHK